MRGLPECFGELPVSVLAEEIDTPGEGQVRALITIAGNPLLSTPNSGRLERAVEGLDFMLSLDIYVNETTRHADVILPAPEPLEKAHYDLALYQLAARNVANYSPAVFERRTGPAEWEVFLRLAGIVTGQGPNADVEAFDDMVIPTLVQREVGIGARRSRAATPSRAARGARAAARPGARARLPAARRPLRRPFGDPAAHARPARAEPARHRPRPARRRGSPRCCARRAGRSSWRPRPIVADLDRLARRSRRERNGGMVLIGRRQLRSNNSWMHNLPALVKGKERCTLHVHPDDAERLGLSRRRPRAAALGRGLARGARWRSPTGSCPAWCRSRTAGATTPAACGWAWRRSTPA